MANIKTDDMERRQHGATETTFLVMEISTNTFGNNLAVYTARIISINYIYIYMHLYLYVFRFIKVNICYEC